MKENAKVSFGMANASMKWNDHITDIIKGIQTGQEIEQRDENEEEMAERAQEDSEGDM